MIENHERAAYRMFGDLPEDFEVDEFDADALPYHPIARGGCGHYHRPLDWCALRDETCDVVGCCH